MTFEGNRSPLPGSPQLNIWGGTVGRERNRNKTARKESKDEAINAADEVRQECFASRISQRSTPPLAKVSGVDRPASPEGHRRILPFLPAETFHRPPVVALTCVPGTVLFPVDRKKGKTMSSQKRGWLIRYPLVLITIFAILATIIGSTMADTIQEDEYHVFLLTEQGAQDCGSACSYSENHVYYLTMPIGYRDSEDDTVVRAPDGEQIGYLAVPD